MEEGKTPRPNLHKVVWKRLAGSGGRINGVKNRTNQQTVRFFRTFTPFPSLAWKHQHWAVFRFLHKEATGSRSDSGFINRWTRWSCDRNPWHFIGRLAAEACARLKSMTGWISGVGVLLDYRHGNTHQPLMSRLAALRVECRICGWEWRNLEISPREPERRTFSLRLLCLLLVHLCHVEVFWGIFLSTVMS